jgi:hypothetical protein
MSYVIQHIPTGAHYASTGWILEGIRRQDIAEFTHNLEQMSQQVITEKRAALFRDYTQTGKTLAKAIDKLKCPFLFESYSAACRAQAHINEYASIRTDSELFEYIETVPEEFIIIEL